MASDKRDTNEVAELRWDEFEQFLAEYENEQLQQFYARIGPDKARLLGATQVTAYRTPGSSYRWATRQKSRK